MARRELEPVAEALHHPASKPCRVNKNGKTSDCDGFTKFRQFVGRRSFVVTTKSWSDSLGRTLRHVLSHFCLEHGRQVRRHLHHRLKEETMGFISATVHLTSQGKVFFSGHREHAGGASGSAAKQRLRRGGCSRRYQSHASAHTCRTDMLTCTIFRMAISLYIRLFSWPCCVPFCFS